MIIIIIAMPILIIMTKMIVIRIITNLISILLIITYVIPSIHCATSISWKSCDHKPRVPSLSLLLTTCIDHLLDIKVFGKQKKETISYKLSMSGRQNPDENKKKKNP